MKHSHSPKGKNKHFFSRLVTPIVSALFLCFFAEQIKCEDCVLLCGVDSSTTSVTIHLGWKDTFEGTSPTWSPDSRFVYYAYQELAYYKAGGEKFHIIRKYDRRREYSETVLSDPMKSQNGPSISPDGKQIAYTVWDDYYSVWIHTLGSNNSHQVSDVHGSIDSPSWLPDGSGIVFSALLRPYWRVIAVDLDERREKIVRMEPIHQEEAMSFSDNWIYYGYGRLSPTVHRMSIDGKLDEVVISFESSILAGAIERITSDSAILVGWSEDFYLTSTPVQRESGTTIILPDGQLIELYIEDIEDPYNIIISPNGKYLTFQRYMRDGPRVTIGRISRVELN